MKKKEIYEWLKKKFYGWNGSELSRWVESIVKGTTWWCDNVGCESEWVSSPGEVFENCPKCDSKCIRFKVEGGTPALYNEDEYP